MNQFYNTSNGRWSAIICGLRCDGHTDAFGCQLDIAYCKTYDTLQDCEYVIEIDRAPDYCMKADEMFSEQVDAYNRKIRGALGE